MVAWWQTPHKEEASPKLKKQPVLHPIQHHENLAKRIKPSRPHKNLDDHSDQTSVANRSMFHAYASGPSQLFQFRQRHEHDAPSLGSSMECSVASSHVTSQQKHPLEAFQRMLGVHLQWKVNFQGTT